MQCLGQQQAAMLGILIITIFGQQAQVLPAVFTLIVLVQESVCQVPDHPVTKGEARDHVHIKAKSWDKARPATQHVAPSAELNMAEGGNGSNMQG